MKYALDWSIAALLVFLVVAIVYDVGSLTPPKPVSRVTRAGWDAK